MVLISHSLGGVLTQQFLNDYLPWALQRESGGALRGSTLDAAVRAYKDRYVKAWVLFSAPLAGAPKALRATISGDDCGFGVRCEGEFWEGQAY